MIIKKKKLKVPIYSFANVELVLVENITDYCERLGISRNNTEPNGTFLYHTENVGQYYIVLKHSSSNSTIAHEALHLTCEILREAGVSLTSESEESYTYLLSWVVDEIYKFLK